jgi:uncharacterized protein YegP (UPF0339 family)
MEPLPKNTKVAQTDSTSWQAKKISLSNGAQFFHELILKNKQFITWVYYYGSKEEAKNYICTIQVTGCDNEEFIYKSHPRTLDESEEEVLNGNCVLSISRDQAKHCVSHGDINISVQISCLKEDAMDEDVE